VIVLYVNPDIFTEFRPPLTIPFNISFYRSLPNPVPATFLFTNIQASRDLVDNSHPVEESHKSHLTGLFLTGTQGNFSCFHHALENDSIVLCLLVSFSKQANLLAGKSMVSRRNMLRGTIRIDVYGSSSGKARINSQTFRLAVMHDIAKNSFHTVFMKTGMLSV
jgi:hypothetical protein